MTVEIFRNPKFSTIPKNIRVGAKNLLLALQHKNPAMTMALKRNKFLDFRSEDLILYKSHSLFYATYGTSAPMGPVPYM